MGSGDSTRDISTETPVDNDERDQVANIDFQFKDNPAIRNGRAPPSYPIIDTDDDQPSDYPEMDFRNLVKDISWGDTVPLTHGIHKHPAIFIPHIPRHLINTFSADRNEDGDRPLVMDPFNGSGTTGIEAKIAGRDFVGVEINPVSKLVSEVATTPIPYTVIGNVKDEVEQRFEETPTTYHEAYDVEFLDNTDKEHWFEQSAIEKLTTIRKVVSEFLEDNPGLTVGLEPRERKVLRDLELTDEELKGRVGRWLVLIIANTVFEISNADPGVSKAHKSKKMRDRIEDGTHPPNAIDVFLEQLDYCGAKLIDLWNKVYQTNVPGGTNESVTVDGAENATFHRYSDNWVEPEVNDAHNATVDIRLDDAREFSFPEYKESVDLAITSPPYINAINYYRGTKLRLFWIQDLLEGTSNIDAEELRRSIVGTNASNVLGIVDELPYLVSDEWEGSYSEYQQTSLPELDTHIKQIHTGELSESTNRAYVTWRFFAEDMLRSLTRVYEHLKPGAYFFFIIGENTIGGRRIQSHQFVADIAENLGKFASAPASISEDDGYRLAGMAWDSITRRDLFQDRDHGNGVIEREWVVILQKPK